VPGRHGIHIQSCPSVGSSFCWIQKARRSPSTRQPRFAIQKSRGKEKSLREGAAGTRVAHGSDFPRALTFRPIRSENSQVA
jgi:hypothetical protein